jgi:hypothetical protein
MSSALDITQSVNPPRAVFLDYPLGHTAGPPNRPDIQIKILQDALKAFSDIQTPGTVRSLPFAWPDNPDWKNAHDMLKDERTERIDVSQYQNEEDRMRAEKRDLSALAVCGCPECMANAG